MMTNLKFSPQSIVGIWASMLALLTCITFVYAVWQWHNDWILAHREISMTRKVVKTDETINMIAAIPNDHLFGKSFAKIGEVPITSLELSVTGIVKVDSEKNHSYSKAYISTSGQPSKIYLIGDALPSGVKIYDITSKEVILENQGQLEKLPLPREQLQFKLRNALE